MERNLYFYEYVRRPSRRVVEILKADPAGLFKSATAASVADTERLAASLHVDVGGLEVGKDVRVELGEVEASDDRARVPIRWRAASQSALFPSMEATLEVEPLSDLLPECQLSLIGTYRPPLSLLGVIGDSLVGHRLAEAAVRNLVLDLKRGLEQGMTSG